MPCPLEPELLDLARGALEAPRRGELTAHLSGCARCAAFVRAHRAVQGILGAFDDAAFEPSELEWRRIDRHVLEAMAHPPTARVAPPWKTWALVLPALALGLLAFFALRAQVRPASPTARALPPAAARSALALAIGGSARTGRPLPEVREGDALSTAQGSLEVQTAPATGIALGAESAAVATLLREGQTVLTLQHGELLAEVEPLRAGESFAIRAGDLVVHVVGTAFLVGRGAGQVRVAVVHGRVRVDREGQPGEVFVSGGTELTIADGAPLEPLQPGPIAADVAARFPLAFPELAPAEVERSFGQAAIESVPTSAHARLDGAERGVTPLTVLAPHGTHQLTLTLPGHVPQAGALVISGTRATARLALPAVLPVDSVPAPVPEAAPQPKRKPVVAPEPPRAEVQVSFQQAFRDAAISHRDEVQRCYAARSGELAPHLHLVLNIQADGHIAPPVQVEEPGVDQRFMDCVTRAARAWSFPAPGRTYEVSIPYDLTP